jgi:hypothetical protein
MSDRNLEGLSDREQSFGTVKNGVVTGILVSRQSVEGTINYACAKAVTASPLKLESPVAIGLVEQLRVVGQP